MSDEMLRELGFTKVSTAAFPAIWYSAALEVTFYDNPTQAEFFYALRLKWYNEGVLDTQRKLKSIFGLS